MKDLTCEQTQKKVYLSYKPPIDFGDKIITDSWEALNAFGPSKKFFATKEQQEKSI